MNHFLRLTFGLLFFPVFIWGQCMNVDIIPTNQCIGIATIIISNGTPPFAYSWEGNIVGNGSDTSSNNQFIIDSLHFGPHTLIIEDSVGCIDTSYFSMYHNVFWAEIIEITPGCTNGGPWGRAKITTNNASFPLLVESLTGQQWIVENSTNPYIYIKPGSYTLTVTDQSNCPYTFDITVPGVNPPVIDLVNITPDSGIGTGAINVAIWATSIYWSNGSQTEDIENLTAGIYSVQAKIQTYFVTCYNTKQFEVPHAAFGTNINNLDCYNSSNGNIDVTMQLGVPPYTFSWTGPNGFTSTDEDISSLSAGNYNLTTTDANNEIFARSFTITEPDLIQLTDNITMPSCYGFSDAMIDITPSGGVEPYVYDWSHLSNSIDTNVVFDLTAGNYTLTITDNNDCIVTEDFSVSEPIEIIVDASITIASDSTSADGSIQASTSLGMAPYSYQWSNGENTAFISQLTSGDYTVTVIDAKGCFTVNTFYVDYLYPEPYQPKMMITSKEYQSKINKPIKVLQQQEVTIPIQIQPNPARSEATLIYQLREAKEVSIAIYSLDGKLIKLLQHKQLKGAGKHKLKIDEDIATGTYLVYLNTANGQSSSIRWTRI